MKKGGLGTLLTFAAVGVGGYLIYKYVFEKKALAAKQDQGGLPTQVNMPDGSQYWYGGPPTAGYANRVWLDAQGNPQQAGPPAPGQSQGGWPWKK